MMKAELNLQNYYQEAEIWQEQITLRSSSSERSIQFKQRDKNEPYQGSRENMVCINKFPRNDLEPL